VALGQITLSQIPHNLWFLILLIALSVAAVVFTLVFVFVVDRKYGRDPARNGAESPRASGETEETDAGDRE
jgi:heme/copper-type cytochrome/quinol oxidase subunit 2